MQQGTASPMAPAVTPALTEITTTTNIDQLFVTLFLSLAVLGANEDVDSF